MLSTSPALVGLAPSRANRIGRSRRIHWFSIDTARTPPLFPFIYLLCLSFPSFQCHRFVYSFDTLPPLPYDITFVGTGSNVYKEAPHVRCEYRVPRAHPAPSLSHRLPVRNASVPPPPLRLLQAPFSFLPFPFAHPHSIYPWSSLPLGTTLQYSRAVRS